MIRQGLVSNSSSSSFVLKLHKPIEDFTFEEFSNFMLEATDNPLKQIFNELKQVKSFGNNEYKIEVGSECETSAAENWILENDYLLEKAGILQEFQSHH